jgi:hypothetical protein
MADYDRVGNQITFMNIHIIANLIFMLKALYSKVVGQVRKRF